VEVWLAREKDDRLPATTKMIKLLMNSQVLNLQGNLSREEIGKQLEQLIRRVLLRAEVLPKEKEEERALEKAKAEA
jgi:hypothetical protein